MGNNELAAPVSTLQHPREMVAVASVAAAELAKVVTAKGWAIKLGNSQHLKMEAWATCARFFSVTVRTLQPRYIEYGGVHGFECSAEALDANGVVIGGASAICMTDEPRWRDRPKYEWKGRVRTKVGVEDVPLHQLASMAATRAASKCLRNIYSWVVVLAGFAPTPAEEMDRDEDGPSDTGESQEPTFRAVNPKESAENAAHVVHDVAVHKVGTFEAGDNKGEKWSMFRVELEAGIVVFTFDADMAAELGMQKGKPVLISWTIDRKGYGKLKGFLLPGEAK